MKFLSMFVFSLLLSVSAFADSLTWIYENQVSFKLAPGLYNLTKSAIEQNYRAPNRPQYVFRNKLGDFSVTFNHLAKKVPAIEMPLFQVQLKEDLLQKLVGVQWLGNKTRVVHGTSWYQSEFKTIEEGALLHTWIVAASWRGRVLEVMISAFDDVDPELPSKVESMIDSLVVTPFQ